MMNSFPDYELLEKANKTLKKSENEARQCSFLKAWLEKDDIP